MIEHPVRWQSVTQRSSVSRPRIRAVVAACFCVGVLLSGCAEHKRPGFVWQTASVVHPRLPAPPKEADVAEREAPPELRIAAPTPTLNFPLGAIARPARPRVATQQPAAVEPGKAQTPSVTPQLSTQESTAQQQEASASLTAAENSLAATQGKSLNAAQADMASKITGFMADARAAAATGDWTSARTLARKAQLLAEELVQSLK
jgi:hypothetical protein